MEIPKKPIQFGIFASLPHKKWAIAALSCVFIATGIDHLSVIILRNLTDAIAIKPLILNSVWIWAILYAFLFFFVQNLWRISGFIGMKWFMNFRSTAYQVLYEYLTLHSKDYFNSRFAGSLTNKIANAVDGSEGLFEKIRSEEHTSELQSHSDLVCRLLLEKKKKYVENNEHG